MLFLFTERGNRNNGYEEKMKRILIVDDDAGVRVTLSIILKKWGYSTVVAESGNKAVEILTQADGSLNAVISDFDMPDGNGQIVINAVKKNWPHIPITILSGDLVSDDGMRRKKSLEEQGAHCLCKPLDANATAALKVFLGS